MCIIEVTQRQYSAVTCTNSYGLCKDMLKYLDQIVTPAPFISLFVYI